MELVLEDVFLVDSVPDPDLAALVRAGDVEPAGAVLGHVDLAAVLGVDVGHLGARQVADDDAVAVTVQERLALGVLVHHDGLPSLRPRQR